jgi:hypothetical protein
MLWGSWSFALLATRVCLALTAVLLIQSVATPKGGAQTPSSTPSTGPSSTSPGSTTGGPQGGNGVGGSGLPFESVILAYQGQAEAAARIAGTVTAAVAHDFPLSGSTPSPQNPTPSPVIIVATSADVAAALQLRIVLTQAALLDDHMTLLKSEIKGGQIFTCATPPPASPKPKSTAKPTKNPKITQLGLTLPLSDIQTVLQTLGSIAAINETITPASGSLADVSLVNLVAARLRPAKVFIPGTFATGTLSLAPLYANPKGSSPKGLLPIGGVQSGISAIGDELNRLESNRHALFVAAETYIGTKRCSADVNKPIVAKIIQEVQAQSAVLDSFETSLLSGQSVAPANAPGNNSSNNTNPNNPGGGKPGSSNNATPAPLSNAAGLAATSSTTPLQQMLAGDLLLSALARLNKDFDKDVYVVSVHALESGGSSLSQTNSIFGGRNFFSGGAVATFSIFKNDGAFLCSGISYGYRGFVQAKDMGTSAAAPAPNPGDENPRAIPATDGSGFVLPNVEHFVSTCP